MKRIYAPWRRSFIEGESQESFASPSNCIFCDYPRWDHSENSEIIDPQKWDRDRLVVTVRAHACVILNKYPYGAGHVMVVPRQHTDRLEELDETDFLDLHRLLQEVVEAIREIYQPEGINIGMNMGQAAGAGIADHIHYHVLPRWLGDHNFMPVLTETKVISEDSATLYQRLIKVLRHNSENE